MSEVQTWPRQEHSALPQAAVTTAGTTIEGSQENAEHNGTYAGKDTRPEDPRAVEAAPM